MKPSKNVQNTNTQPSITSFFTTTKNNKQKLVIRPAKSNDIELRSNYSNTINHKLNYDKQQTTISTNLRIKKKLSKTASLIGRLKTTTSLFIKKLKDKKRQRKKQERVKEISRQESKTNLRSTRNAYTFHHSDHSSNSSSDKSSSFYPSSNESNNISNDSNYKYKFISKNECAQSKSSSSSNSISIDCATKYIKNKVEPFIKKVSNIIVQ